MTPGPLNHEVRFTQVASGARIAWARSGRLGGPVSIRTGHWLTHVEYDLRSLLWRPAIERLGRQVELVRYDERGCGLSGADEVPLTLDTALEELTAVVRAHGAPRVALLGVSGGAAPAVAYAAQHPDRVSHLVLLGGGTHGLLHRQVKPEVLAFHEAQLRLIELGWGRKDPGVQQMFTSRFMPAASAEHIASFNEHQRMSCDGARAAAIVRARAATDVRHWAAAVRVPTLVLHSEGDMAMPLALGHELAAAIPGARFEALQSRNHIPVSPEPAFERMCQVITSFVTESSKPPALTPAERALAALVAQGLDNLQITAHLGLAEKTVRNRLSALYAKLGVEGRAMAVVKARELGL
jgi:pimeloyl-ACP methyl ester carboxylesterase/DNA-binding CsgD family transcriptional regulator